MDRLSSSRDPDKTGICSHTDTIVFKDIDLWGQSARQFTAWLTVFNKF